MPALCIPLLQLLQGEHLVPRQAPAPQRSTCGCGASPAQALPCPHMQGRSHSSVVLRPLCDKHTFTLPPQSTPVRTTSNDAHGAKQKGHAGNLPCHRGFRGFFLHGMCLQTCGWSQTRENPELDGCFQRSRTAAGPDRGAPLSVPPEGQQKCQRTSCRALALGVKPLSCLSLILPAQF